MIMPVPISGVFEVIYYLTDNHNHILVMTYTKRDIVRRISEKKNVPMVQVEPWVDAVIESIRDTMMEANPTCRIEIRDFGVFEVKVTKAKPKARNPKTNEVIYVPEHRKTHFKPSKLLKEFLRQPLEKEEVEEA